VPPLTWKKAAQAATLSCALAVALFTDPASAEYRLRPGDMIEVAVTGLPDFRQRSVIGPDGDVTVPLLKALKIAGLGLPEAQSLIKDQLSKKLFQQKGLDGKDIVTAISPDAVVVTIAEYRPVYLNGDVSKPGQQAYRPGMTVRQAIALAGGYEIMRFRMNNPFLESADLRNAYQTAWMNYVERQAAIWRVQSQLNLNQAGAAPQALEKMTEGPIPASLLEGLRANARQQLTAAVDRYQAERNFLLTSVKTADDQIDLLKERQAKDDENVQADTSDYEKLKDFSKKGNLPATRLAEARRLYLYSATQSLQTNVQYVTTLREREEAERSVARLLEATNAELLKQLQILMVERDSLLSQLQAVSEKVTYTGMIRSQLVRGGAMPKIKIVHADADGGGEEEATEGSLVRPGDTIDVALHTEEPAGALQ
jgi:polysaccharide biosynthesis/export protein